MTVAREKVKLYGSQCDVFEDTSPAVLYIGPAGTGKTLACLTKLYYLCTNLPNVRCLLVRSTRKSLTTTTLITFEKFFGRQFKQITKSYRTSYDFETGSVIDLGGLDSPSKILSSDYDIIFVEEVTAGVRLEDYEILSTRLRNFVLPYQQILMAGNPTAPHHWAKQLVNAGKVKYYTANHKENPSLWDGKNWTAKGQSYISKLQGLGDLARKRFYEGKWAAAEGVIFTEYDEKQHVVDTLPDHFDSFHAALDWGFTDAGVALFFGMSGGVLYLLQTLMYRSQNYWWWGQRIMSSPWYKAHPDIQFVADSANPGAISLLNQMGANIIPCKKGQGSVLRNIAAIKARLLAGSLKIYRFSNDTPDKDMLNDHQPTTLQEEFESYCWKDGKEIPVDADNHCIDALGYLLHYLDGDNNIPCLVGLGTYA
jgi:PBSX family phage terminase large subunit